jgi:hypothetical protein
VLGFFLRKPAGKSIYVSYKKNGVFSKPREWSKE